MEKLRTAASMPFPEVWKRLCAWRFGRRVVLFVTVGTVLLAGFSAEEYWRGKRAWKKCKTELASKGAILEWESLSGSSIAEEDNFFAAPGMMEWFGSAGTNELTAKLSLPDLDGSANLQNNRVLARITVVALDAEIAEQDADAVLQYRDSQLTLSPVGRLPAGETNQTSAIIPLIVMDDVPLSIAIQNLARHAGINYIVDPAAGLSGPDPQPSVTIRWENVTARQALRALLDNYSLERVITPQGIPRVQPKDPSGPQVTVEAGASERLEILLWTALEQGGNPVPVRGLTGAQNLSLLERPITLAKPLRLAVRTDELLTEKEMAQFLPTTVFASIRSGNGAYLVTPATASAYRVTLGPHPCCTASDYLTWTERCQPDFDRIRAALKRPGTRLPGLYEKRNGIPERGFVGARLAAQTLAQRAQCYLLLNQPEAALRELTLVHDLQRVLTCKPVTLVAGMFNVAVTGIYVEAVKGGLQMNVWREPQLAVIEEQLREVNLVAPVIDAFQRERLTVLQMLESGRLADLYRRSEPVFVPPAQPNNLYKLRKASYGLLVLVPRGWVYQNMATIGSLHQGFLDAADGTKGTIDLRQIDAAARRVQEVVQQRQPGTFLAAAAFPMFTRAWQTVASNQALVNEVSAGCARERDRLEREPHSD